jgi:outer membrane immunogenic protein
MKKLLSISALAVAAALVWAGSANAADMPLKAAPPPLPPPPAWTGMYIGINGGYGWNTSRHSVPGLTTGDFNFNGGLFGVTYGGNWQMGSAVLGFESDYDWADFNGSSAAVCGAVSCFTKTKSFATERMRAGWDWNGWLLYGTAGAAFARTQAGVTGCPAVASCDERWRSGWTAGVGVETIFWRTWSAKVEYLHYDLGNSFNYGGGAPVSVKDQGDMVRAGINYHFDLLNLLHF